MRERRFLLHGENLDRGLAFKEYVWAPSYSEAVRRANQIREWQGKVRAHRWTGREHG